MQRQVLTLALTFLVASCGADSKPYTTNNSATNNSATNNSATNNSATNNSATNNSTTNNSTTNNMLEVCPAGMQTGEPERLLGFSQSAVEASIDGTVSSVADNALTIDPETQEQVFVLGVVGIDLTERFTVGDAVTFGRLAGAGMEQSSDVVDWVTGPNGTVQVVRMQRFATDDVGTSIELRSSHTVSLGDVTWSERCLVEQECAQQPRSRTTNDITVSDGGDETVLPLSEVATLGEWTFYPHRAGTLSYELVEVDDCVLEGGTDVWLDLVAFGPAP